MVRTAFVNIWKTRVGAIAWDEKSQIASFEYDPSFNKHKWDLSPIKMPIEFSRGTIFSFPENRGTFTFKGLPGLLADILPDKYGYALINAWLNSLGRPSDSLNPVETLCFIGTRGMGALEIEPPDPKEVEEISQIEISSLVAIAENILTNKKSFRSSLSDKNKKSLHDILKIGTSAGGARAKALIAYNEKTKEILSGQADAPNGFNHWLIKFDGVIDKQFGASSGYGRVEMAYHLMAKDAEIEMTECKLLEENGRAHFMTKRFDRDEKLGKLHVQTFCAMQHYDYNEVNLYSYEQLFETMRILALPYPQAEQLFRRMVFNVFSKNCDDHTKNFAFLMDQKGLWRLAPAYDLCHAYRPDSDWVSRHALSVNGKRNHIAIDDLLIVGKQMNIKKAKHIIEQIQNILSNWNKYANEVGTEKKLRDAIKDTLFL